MNSRQSQQLSSSDGVSSEMNEMLEAITTNLETLRDAMRQPATNESYKVVSDLMLELKLNQEGLLKHAQQLADKGEFSGTEKVFHIMDEAGVISNKFETWSSSIAHGGSSGAGGAGGSSAGVGSHAAGGSVQSGPASVSGDISRDRTLDHAQKVSVNPQAAVSMPGIQLNPISSETDNNAGSGPDGGKKKKKSKKADNPESKSLPGIQIMSSFRAASAETGTGTVAGTGSVSAPAASATALNPTSGSSNPTFGSSNAAPPIPKNSSNSSSLKPATLVGKISTRGSFDMTRDSIAQPGGIGNPQPSPTPAVAAAAAVESDPWADFSAAPLPGAVPAGQAPAGTGGSALNGGSMAGLGMDLTSSFFNPVIPAAGGPGLGSLTAPNLHNSSPNSMWNAGPATVNLDPAYLGGLQNQTSGSISAAPGDSGAIGMMNGQHPASQVMGSFDFALKDVPYSAISAMFANHPNEAYPIVMERFALAVKMHLAAAMNINPNRLIPRIA